MKKIKLTLTTLAVAAIVLITGCKKEDITSPSGGTSTPIVIPVQTTSQATLQMGAASGLAILAGSAISNTGSTNVTGDMGLSPGTSVGGFPPGILVGVLHINDATATQAKLDLTAAYNDAAGR